MRTNTKNYRNKKTNYVRFNKKKHKFFQRTSKPIHQEGPDADMFEHSFCPLYSSVPCHSAGSIESNATPPTTKRHRPMELLRIPVQNCQTKYREKKTDCD